MHVVLTGATGFIGSAVLTRLIDAGHSVTAVVRSEKSRDAAAGAGASAVVLDVADTGALAEVLRGADAAIHTASPGDATSPAVDDAVIDAAFEAFAGSTKPFILTGGVWSWGSSADIAETSPVDAPAIVAWRSSGQARVLSGEIAGNVVAPAVVYGNGAGIPAIIAATEVVNGTANLIGSGDQHWTTVHVDDLADLYLLVLESGVRGETYLGASGANPTVRELTAAALGSSVALEPQSTDATRARFGDAFADALLLDQQATGAKAKALGWVPTRPSLVSELERGYSA